MFGNHRDLSFGLIRAFKVDDHPIAGLSKPMRGRTVGKKRGELPSVPLRMQDRKAGLARRVEPARFDGGQLVDIAAIRLINRKNVGD